MVTKHGRGSIEVICGSMFAGKTQELIRRLRLAQIARQRVQVFKSVLDDRYDATSIVSHDMVSFSSEVIRSPSDILKRVRKETQVVGIDEVHFLDRTVVAACETLAGKGKRVIAAGLDLDYLGKPFESTALLMACAEFVTKNLAICVRCGQPASRSFRMSGGGRRIEVGHSDKYEARCRSCFNGRRGRKSAAGVSPER